MPVCHVLHGAIRVIWGPEGLSIRIVLRNSVQSRNVETLAILPVSRYQYISSSYSIGNFSDINAVQFAIFETVVRATCLTLLSKSTYKLAVYVEIQKQESNESLKCLQQVQSEEFLVTVQLKTIGQLIT